MLEGKTVLLGVTGSIAAYKIAYLASTLKKQQADVHVLMTRNATILRHLPGINALWIPLTGIFSSR